MTVTCEHRSCRYCDTDGFCSRDSITISDYDTCCDSEDYFETAEYSNEFWKAFGVLDEKTGKRDDTVTPYRVLGRGKRIEKFGLTFFTEDDDRYPDECYLTEEQSGYGMGYSSSVTAYMARKIGRLKLPNVMTYKTRQELLEENENRAGEGKQ